MTLSDALERLDALLLEERLAICSIEADRVLAIADEKLALLEVLRAGDWLSAGDLRRRYRELVPRLRENGVLLAHARNSARELVQALTAGGSPTYDARGVAIVAAGARRVSINA